MSESASRRGPYAKGIAKRRQILREALLAYAESDSTGPSLRAVAARAGLSERGLLHYFASRDNLFVSILRERDAAELELIGAEPHVGTLAAVQARSASTPGLVRLFFELAAAAPDPANPAHAFFTGRYERLRAFMGRVVRRSGSGVAARRDPLDPDFLARILIAASDGLQMQWLLDQTIDLESDLKRLAEALGLTTDADTSSPDSAHAEAP